MSGSATNPVSEGSRTRRFNLGDGLEPSWIDRLGRAVGCGIIVAVAAQAVLDTMHPF